ncbi:hypothetical protein ABT023_28520 [Micromonospora sp. NPDC002296]|uniref:hypothetical protein n=1 Tax=Micromonospora sp. NPDC002296 TaxID=3154271 RepID=UPI00331FA31B
MGTTRVAALAIKGHQVALMVTLGAGDVEGVRDWFDRWWRWAPGEAARTGSPPG